MKNIEKFNTSYLSHKTVFLMDFLLFCASTALVVLMLGYMSDTGMYRGAKFFSIAMMTTCVMAPLSMLIFKGHTIVIRRMSMSDVGSFVLESVFHSFFLFLTLALVFGFNSGLVMLLFADLIISLVALIAVRSSMIYVYHVYQAKVRERKKLKNALVYGIGPKSSAVVMRLEESSHYNVIGFITEEGDGRMDASHISKLPVYKFADEKQFSRIISSNIVECIIYADENEVREQQKKSIHYCIENHIKSMVVPHIDEMKSGDVITYRLREVEVTDILGRPEIKVDMDRIKELISGKVVMVTGGAGSIGSELCRQLARMDVEQIVVYDNAETPMHNLRLELEKNFPGLRLAPIIGDVRILARLDYAFSKYRPQVVFHAAAYKHVPLMEENPCEAVLVNVAGSRNVADKCVEYGVEKMVMISTDKAVNPTNIMGCTKRLAEIYVQSLSQAMERGEVKGSTKFITTRFGNVLGSNGSVIPRFREQIREGGPVTVTDPNIIRYFMTIPEACRLVLEAGTMDFTNKIAVFDMGEPVKIDDVARKMIRLSGLEVDKDIAIKYTGLRPGEKLYEEVLANHEDTDPTSHERIRLADVRPYPYDKAKTESAELERLSREVNIPDMVYLMKTIVPEYKSNNSKFVEIDRKIETESK